MKRILLLLVSHIAAAIAGIVFFYRWMIRIMRKVGKANMTTLKDGFINFLDILLYGYVRHPFTRYRYNEPPHRYYTSYNRYHQEENEDDC